MGILYSKSEVDHEPTPPPLKHRPTTWSVFENEITRDNGATAAGIYCSDGTYVLAGYQPHKARPCISGIGGYCEPTDMDTAATAFREMMEELFGVAPPPLYTFETLLGYVPNYVRSGTYVNYTLTFAELERMMARLGIDSPYYTTFPTTVAELIALRKTPESAEIRELYLIDARFVSDMHGDCV